MGGGEVKIEKEIVKKVFSKILASIEKFCFYRWSRIQIFAQNRLKTLNFS